jgi:hypothetical protein
MVNSKTSVRHVSWPSPYTPIDAFGTTSARLRRSLPAKEHYAARSLSKARRITVAFAKRVTSGVAKKKAVRKAKRIGAQRKGAMWTRTKTRTDDTWASRLYISGLGMKASWKIVNYDPIFVVTVCLRYIRQLLDATGSSYSLMKNDDAPFGPSALVPVAMSIGLPRRFVRSLERTIEIATRRHQWNEKKRITGLKSYKRVMAWRKRTKCLALRGSTAERLKR